MFFSYLTILVALLAQCLAKEIPSCPIPRGLSQGFRVKFFNYPFGSDIGFSKNYFYQLYKGRGPIHQLEEIQDTNFNHFPQYRVKPNHIYGFPITTTNYTMEFSGYFYSRWTGTYEIAIRGPTGFSFSLGRGENCTAEALESVPHHPDHQAVAKYPNESVHEGFSYELKEGVFYPIKIVIFNQRRTGVLEIKARTPEGELFRLGDFINKLDYDYDPSNRDFRVDFYN